MIKKGAAKLKLGLQFPGACSHLQSCARAPGTSGAHRDHSVTPLRGTEQDFKHGPRLRALRRAVPYGRPRRPGAARRRRLGGRVRLRRRDSNAIDATHRRTTQAPRATAAGPPGLRRLDGSGRGLRPPARAALRAAGAHLRGSGALSGPGAASFSVSAACQKEAAAEKAWGIGEGHRET